MSGFVLEGGVTANCIDGTVEFSDANGDVADQPECIGIYFFLRYNMAKLKINL